MMIPFPVRLAFRTSWNFLRFKEFSYLKEIVLVSACGLALSIQFHYRTPGRLLFLLVPLVGAVLSLFSVMLLFKPFFTRGAQGKEIRRLFERVEGWGGVLVRIFVYYSLFLYANAKLDRSDPVDQPTEILEISGGKITLGVPLSYSWATLRSWEDPGQVKRLLLQAAERRSLWGGESVSIQIRRGYFGLPWIQKIERDDEKYSREILKRMPTASQAWKNLIDFYLDHQRWKEATDAAHRYLKIYPNAYDVAINVGGAMNMAGHYSDAISLFEYVVARKPTYEVHQLLGWALSFQGDKKRAAAVLEASIPMNPEDWEAYYHLGYVYTDMAKPAEAIAMFEKVLERQPDFPEVEEQIALNRSLLPKEPFSQQRGR